MKKYVSVFSIFALITMCAFAEDVPAEIDLETIIEEVAEQAESGTEITEFTTHPEGDADFVMLVNQERDTSLGNDEIVIAFGERGDFLTYVTATPEILDIYNNKEKTAMFLSVENPAQYIQPGKCLVNTIPYDVLEEFKTENQSSECSWRLFCGDEMNYDAFYAVELCGQMVEN